MQEEYYKEQEGGKPHKELKFINSGAYGCIFTPSLTCKGKIGSDRYITKIQKSKRSIMNEVTISERIRKIVGYTKYYAPVLNSCEVQITKDRLRDLKKCELFENEQDNKLVNNPSYVSLKIRYVGDIDMNKYFLTNVNSPEFFNELIRTHIYVLKGIQKLHKNGIVHSDLKSNNIMMDATRNVPIIIDFGQSWLVSDVNIEQKALNIFFVFDQYNYWSIDVLVCNYIIQNI